MPKPTSQLDRIEAIARRRLLAAVTPRDRCLAALALMVIELYQKNQNDLDSLPLSSEIASSGVPTAERQPRRQGQRA